MHITPFEASVWARRQRMGDIGAKIILMLLADYSDDEGTCFPGIDRIAEETEQSKSTVLRKLRLLAELGLISVERRNGEGGHRTSNRYRLDLSVTVTKSDVEVAKERLRERHDEDGSVQGVNLTPGPKCQPEASKVSPGDTVTTSRTTSPTPYPRDAAAEGASADAAPRLALVPDSAPSAPVSGPEIAFLGFWQEYPRKVGKAAAEKAWRKAARGPGGRLAEIMLGLEAHKREWQRKGTALEFIPHPATWLNNRRWEDEIGTAEIPLDPWMTMPTPSQQAEAWR